MKTTKKPLIYIGLIIFSINVSCTKNSKTPIEELKLIGQKMQEIQYVMYSYTVESHTSYGGNGPTNKGEAYFRAEKSDTIIGANFRFKQNQYEVFYDGDYKYSMNKSDSSVFKRPLIVFHKNGGTVDPLLELSYWAIKLFLSNPNIENEIDSLVRSNVKINSKQYIRYSFTANEKFLSTHKQRSKSNKRVELIIDNTTQLPLSYSLTLNFKSGNRFETNFDKAHFRNYSFKDEITPSFFSIESIPDYYDWTKMKFMNKTLATNESAPEWKLPKITGDSISLKDYKGKYLLLNFWFIGCGPCRESIPILNKLQTKFDNNILSVLGVNCHSYDVKEIKTYCTNQGMEYPNVWNGDSISESYKINAAPIFYLINPEGNIVYTSFGLDEKLIEEIENIIKS